MRRLPFFLLLLVLLSFFRISTDSLASHWPIGACTSESCRWLDRCVDDGYSSTICRHIMWTCTCTVYADMASAECMMCHITPDVNKFAPFDGAQRHPSYRSAQQKKKRRKMRDFELGTVRSVHRQRFDASASIQSTLWSMPCMCLCAVVVVLQFLHYKENRWQPCYSCMGFGSHSIP